MLVRPEGDNAALDDNVNPDSPRRASVANKPRYMQPCCLPLLAYIPLILASLLCCTKNRAERGSLLPKEVSGYLWSTRLRSFGISKRPTAGHWTLDNKQHQTLETDWMPSIQSSVSQSHDAQERKLL